MADYNSVAKAFIQYYYDTFDSSREQLRGLYRDTSMLSFENDAFQGATAITEKLVSLAFKTVKHKVSTTDAQPSSESGSILIMVTGMLAVDEAEHPMSFTQTFNLVPDGQGGYYVLNDIFRMVLG